MKSPKKSKFILIAILNLFCLLPTAQTFAVQKCFNLESFRDWTLQQKLRHHGAVIAINGIDDLVATNDPGIMSVLKAMITVMNAEASKSDETITQRDCSKVTFGGGAVLTISSVSDFSPNEKSFLVGSLNHDGQSIAVDMLFDPIKLIMTSNFRQHFPQLNRYVEFTTEERWNYDAEVKFIPSPIVWQIFNFGK